jgi:hypothetical protein
MAQNPKRMNIAVTIVDRNPFPDVIKFATAR